MIKTSSGTHPVDVRGGGSVLPAARVRRGVQSGHPAAFLALQGHIPLEPMPPRAFNPSRVMPRWIGGNGIDCRLAAVIGLNGSGIISVRVMTPGSSVMQHLSDHD